MNNELRVVSAEAGRMLNDLGPLLGGLVVCVVVLAGSEVHLMFPAEMRREIIEAVEDAIIVAALGGDGD